MADNDPEDQNVIDELVGLAQLDFDAIHAYELAIERIDPQHADVRIELESYREDHQRHVVELNAVIALLGGEPPELGRDLKGVLIDGLTKLRAATGTVGALKAMRMNEKLTNRSYQKALDMDMPPVARDLVELNFEDERRHLSGIQAMLMRLHDLDVDADVDDDADEGIDTGVTPGVRM